MDFFRYSSPVLIPEFTEPTVVGESCKICNTVKPDVIKRLFLTKNKKRFFVACLNCYVTDYKIPEL